MKEERRTSPRFPFVQVIEYSQPDGSSDGSISGNMSLSGISLKIQKFIPVGALLQLQIRLGSSPKVSWIKGEVVRVRKILSEDCYELGLKFENDEMNIKAISTYINHRNREGV